MNNGGIIRKIDELGRIVIPKEIRRSLAIRDGENLEIVVANDTIILKKYNYIKSIEDISKKITQIYSTISNSFILITDRDKIISSTYDQNLFNKKIDEYLVSLIDNRESAIEKKIITFEDITLDCEFIVTPIINEIDCIGLVIICNDFFENKEIEIKISKLISKILSEKLNIS